SSPATPLCILTFLSSFALFAPAPPAPEIYTLSLHDALPIYPVGIDLVKHVVGVLALQEHHTHIPLHRFGHRCSGVPGDPPGGMRSEEHTSELQSRFDLVCRLLLEKKKKCPRRRCKHASIPCG